MSAMPAERLPVVAGEGPTITVRVPATSANLGPGFDSFGLALARYDEVSVCRTDGPLEVVVSGFGADDVPLDDRHLIIRAIGTALTAAGAPADPTGLRLTCVNRIPHGGGLGSSAAAIVAGLLLGRELAAENGRRLSDDELLALATAMEGHPDNVAPALVGGFTLAFTGEDGVPVAIRRDVHPDVRIVVFAAQESSSTHHTRGLLPATVPHADAAANAADAALLVHALTVDPAYLLPATRDRLHQPYRAASMPASAALMTHLRAAGVPAVISGAGPSVIALVAGDFDVNAWRRPGFDVDFVPVCPAGARLVD
ncbi:homoserine kinase [Nakamurella sp.]|uniref:homoserine kinase n=1 Tax=Nakamurella sp. TaxID=1869182 RepID=UPI003B3A5F66